ncbi:helix-turn-helix transcriptional regulator [Rummeliibacillus sp. TYF-LIM-RU47]|uniref:helix-turn-helix domain-containing protein n=1 Tax=Rummeliibacillus sp. TYF-LIM-RU47 TaxID=2608406 RepID=UPI00123AB976|nr:helix-turn-helix transcriptional regulator [Rummeliibacillus sp. TYF-LIM-RU47]
MSYIINIKLKQLMKEFNVTQRDLEKMTGLSRRTISELSNNKMERIPKSALSKIGEAFAIEDIRELIDFKNEQ